jgi:hypothetical protein
MRDDLGCRRRSVAALLRDLDVQVEARAIRAEERDVLRSASARRNVKGGPTPWIERVSGVLLIGLGFCVATEPRYERFIDERSDVPCFRALDSR